MSLLYLIYVKTLGSFGKEVERLLPILTLIDILIKRFFGRNEPNRGTNQVMNHIVILIYYLIFIGIEKKMPHSHIEIKNRILEDELEEQKLAVRIK